MRSSRRARIHRTGPIAPVRWALVFVAGLLSSPVGSAAVTVGGAVLVVAAVVVVRQFDLVDRACAAIGS